MTPEPFNGPKKRWPDGIERICDGSIIHHGSKFARYSSLLHTTLTPREVRELMRTSEEDLLELPHHADPNVPIYVNRDTILAIDARFARVEE